jgi:hypothetical protein
MYGVCGGGGGECHSVFSEGWSNVNHLNYGKGKGGPRRLGVVLFCRRPLSSFRSGLGYYTIHHTIRPSDREGLYAGDIIPGRVGGPSRCNIP